MRKGYVGTIRTHNIDIWLTIWIDYREKVEIVRVDEARRLCIASIVSQKSFGEVFHDLDTLISRL